MRRRIGAVLSVFAVFLPSVVLAQESGDAVPLSDWAVPFEQIRGKVMETEPSRIAERSLHPSVNAVPSAASHFITMVPCRVYDSRSSAPGTPLTDNTSRTIDVVSGPCAGIPSNAAAYSMNITAFGSTSTGSYGFITAYPTGSTRPTTSTMNFLTGSQTSNAAIIPAGTTGSIDIYSTNTTNFVLDINGYFVEGVVTNLTAGTGLTGGGTGNVTLGLAPGGVGSTQLAGNAVTTGAIQDGAVTGAKIASGQVVKSLNGLNDALTIAATGGATINTAGSTITVNTSALAAPSGSVILGVPGDTNLIGAGYTEIGPSPVENWRATSLTNAPSARSAQSTVWTGTKMIIWGGYDGSSGLNTGGQYDPATDTWSSTSTTLAPTARFAHTAVWASSKMIIWGGSEGTGTTYANTGGQYDPLANSWTATNTFGAPSGRRGHTAVWNGTYMIVWGGSNGGTILNTGGRYRPVQDDWAPTTTAAGVPSARIGHSAVWNTATNSMIVWGGFDGLADLNTGAGYDPAADTWTATSTTGAPSARYLHTAVWTGTRMIVWGGSSAAYENTGGIYNPVADTWTATSTAGAPDARDYHSAVWTGQKMFVWGGVGGGVVLNSGASFDPASNSWSAPMTTVNAPAPRYLLSLVWTGTKLLVWGGWAGSGGTYFNSGGQWVQLSLYQKN